MELFDDLISGRRSNGKSNIERSTKAALGGCSALPGVRFSETGRHHRGNRLHARHLPDHQRLQQQLIQSERLAAMGQMIAGVAHELNNPLTAILGVTELMRDQASNETSHRHLDLAHRQARRAAHMWRACSCFRAPRRRETPCST